MTPVILMRSHSSWVPPWHSPGIWLGGEAHSTGTYVFAGLDPRHSTTSDVAQQGLPSPGLCKCQVPRKHLCLTLGGMPCSQH